MCQDHGSCLVLGMEISCGKSRCHVFIQALQKIPLYMMVYFGNRQAKMCQSQLMMMIVKTSCIPHHTFTGRN